MTLLDVLQHSRIPHRRSSSDPSEINVHCPFCLSRGKPPDDRFKLGINTRTGAAHCFVCNWGSKRYGPTAFLRRLRVESNTFGMEPEDPVALPPVELPRDFTQLDNSTDDLDFMALQYLIDRGVTQEQIARHRIGVSWRGRYAWRIIFSVYCPNLQMIVGRDFAGGREPKYLNSRGEKHLYGFDPEAETVIFSEGIFKSLRIAQATGAASAALLGHSLGPAQMRQIRDSKCRRVVLWPDPDRPGREGVVKIAENLMDWKGDVRVVWPVSGYADEAPLESLARDAAGARKYGWGLSQKILLGDSTP